MQPVTTNTAVFASFPSCFYSVDWLTHSLVLQLRSANKHFDFSSVKEWLFVTPKTQVATLVAFLELQIALLPCIPDAKVRTEVHRSGDFIDFVAIDFDFLVVSFYMIS